MHDGDAGNHRQQNLGLPNIGNRYFKHISLQHNKIRILARLQGTGNVSGFIGDSAVDGEDTQGRLQINRLLRPLRSACLWLFG